MRIRSKVVVVGGVVAALAAGGTAYAFWSSTGTGTGSGNVGTVTNGDIVLDGTLSGDLVPGGTATLAVTVANNSAAPVRIGPVSATVSVKDGSNNEINNVCQISATTYNQNTTVPANQAATALGNLTVSMVNDANVNQDACKSATITFQLSSATPI